MEGLTVALIAGLCAMFGWAFADFFAKKTIDEIGDTVTLVWGHIFGSVFILALLFSGVTSRITTGEFSPTPKLIVTVMAFGIVQAIIYTFVYRGFGKGQLVLLGPIFSSFSGITAVLAILVLGEVLTPPAMVGGLLLFAGILVVNTDIEAFKSKKLQLTKVDGFPEIITATILAALWTFFWGIVLKAENWLIFTSIMYITMTVSLILYNWLRGVSLKVTKPSTWKFLALIGAGEVLAYLAISVGFSLTNFISIVVLLSSAFSIPAIILAYFFLKEKVQPLQVVGVLVLLAGILVLAGL